ncbi:MAG: FHA domain-containing protein [Anaerolineae bacterium]|nr:FHA domain-containing protein [Anaerolineae bacterium]
MRYAVRRVSPLSALLYGLLLGLAGWLVPGVLLGLLARAAVARLLAWLAALNFVLPLPLTDGIAIDLVPLLQLSDAQTRLAALSARETGLILVVALATAAAGMLLTGLSTMLGALVYNLLARGFGGVEVTLDPLDAAAGGSAAPRPARPAGDRARASAAPAPPPTPAVPPPLARPNRPPPAPGSLPTKGGDWLPLGDDVTRIGSAPDNDIVLAGLSPQHAEIRCESGRYLLYDLGSRRTWVNDAQVAAVHMLKDGFRVQLGQAEFTAQIVS